MQRGWPFVRPEVLHDAGVFLGGLWAPEQVEGGSAAADYIQLCRGDADALRESLEHIRVAASEILTALSAEVPAAAL